jgi:hypothetical protein
MTERVTIKGSTNGYRSDQTFELTNGQIWQQSRYAYNYHYQYRPDALLDANGSSGRLKIDGMDEWVEVRRIR